MTPKRGAELRQHTGREVMTYVSPGEALSLQFHERKDETFFVARGEIRLEVEEDGRLIARSLVEGDSYHVTPTTRHRMTGGPAGAAAGLVVGQAAMLLVLMGYGPGRLSLDHLVARRHGLA